MSEKVIARQLRQTLTDPIRNKQRIEIPAACSLWLDGNDLKQALKIILEEQQQNGFWLERSYEQNDVNTGYYGAVPTCFATLALLRGHNVTSTSAYLEAAIRACDYFILNERNGYVLKAAMNKSDVLNTNLLVAYCLHQAMKELPPSSLRQTIYKGAMNRILRRSIQSQHLSGALPYTSYGLTVPFLYHSMSTALLFALSEDSTPQRLSAMRGYAFMKSYINTGSIEWSKEAFPEKSGSTWATAWSIAAASYCDNVLRTSLEKRLKRLRGEIYFTSESSQTEDPFFSAWVLLALYFKSTHQVSPRGHYTYYLHFLLGLPKKIRTGVSQLTRILFRWKLDKGPIEYW